MAFTSTALKGALLLGLVMTGVVEKDAAASSESEVSAQTLSTTAAGDFVGQFQNAPQHAFHGLDQESRSHASSPASIELLIEAPDYSHQLPIYFMKGSAELTPEAQLAVLELASEITGREDPAIHIFPMSDDDILNEARIEAISLALSDAGLHEARTFTTPQIDILLARSL